jgi:serine O-acetyltransferase
VGCFRSLGVHAIVIFRFGKWVKERNIILRLFLEPVFILLSHRIRSKWGIVIPRSVEIGEGFYIGHFGGITIGGAAKIGKNVSISQLVVIGKAGRGEKSGHLSSGIIFILHWALK